MKNEIKLTDKEMYHITSSLCVVFTIELTIASILNYIVPTYSTPIMQFMFLLMATLLFFESVKKYQRINIDRKLDIE